MPWLRCLSDLMDYPFWDMDPFKYLEPTCVFLKLHVFWLLARNNPRFTFRFCLLNSSDVSKACIKYVMDGVELIPLMYSKCRSVDAGTKKLFSEWYRLKKVLVRNSEILGTDRNVWKAPEIIDYLSFSGNSTRRT